MVQKHTLRTKGVSRASRGYSELSRAIGATKALLSGCVLEGSFVGSCTIRILAADF